MIHYAAWLFLFIIAGLSFFTMDGTKFRGVIGLKKVADKMVWREKPFFRRLKYGNHRIYGAEKKMALSSANKQRALFVPLDRAVLLRV
jgi:hypothetical protein